MPGATSGSPAGASPRRVRVQVAGRIVADSTRAVLLREAGGPARYAFPHDDVGADAAFVEPLGREGLVAIRADAVEAWYEEDERLIGGPRDPFHRVDAVWSTRHVAVRLRGRLVAETRAPCLVFETGLPTRYYLSRDDVRMELLKRSATRTECQYKGVATYFSVAVEGTVSLDVAWSYETPLPQQPKLASLICFDPARVDGIDVDGEPSLGG